MRVSTKTIFDIESGEIISRESYEYDGPVIHLGSIFSKLVGGPLTNSGVTDPTTGATTFQNSPAATGLAMATDAAQNAPIPQASEIVNPTIGTDGSEGGQVITHDAYTPPQPKEVHPTFAQANTAGGFLSPELNTKGKILAGIIQATQGAAAGAAAAVPTNPHISPGLGPSLAAGFQTPFIQQQQRNSLINEGLAQQEKQAQIQNIPLNRLLLGADIQNKQSGTAKNFADATAAQSKGQLDLAEAITKPFIKTEDGSMYQAGRNPDGTPSLTPVTNIGTTLPVSQDLANSVGRPDLAGKFLPAKTISDLSGIVDKGQTITSANGRQIIVDKVTKKQIADLGIATPVMSANIRTEGMGQMREYPMLDSKNSNSPMMMNSNDINAGNKSEPGRYQPAGTATAALSKTALIEDIRGNLAQVRQSLQNPKMPEFDAGTRAKMALALRSRDPGSAVQALVTGEAGKSLTPEQQEYLINQSLLTENAMAMRSVLGAGQGSDDLRSAVTATIPGITTFSKAYALKQADGFEKVLNRLEAGIPKVSLRSDTGAGSGAAGSSVQPAGATHTAPGSDGQLHYTNAQGQDLGAVK